MNESTKRNKIVKKIVLIALLIGVFFLVKACTGTASFQRKVKTFKSDFNGGIERTVSVYDIDGNLIKSYEGKFDIVNDDNRILFDDEKGKRHQIYFNINTVIVDEK